MSALRLMMDSVLHMTVTRPYSEYCQLVFSNLIFKLIPAQLCYNLVSFPPLPPPLLSPIYICSPFPSPPHPPSLLPPPPSDKVGCDGLSHLQNDEYKLNSINFIWSPMQTSAICSLRVSCFFLTVMLPWKLSCDL